VTLLTHQRASSFTPSTTSAHTPSAHTPKQSPRPTNLQPSASTTYTSPSEATVIRKEFKTAIPKDKSAEKSDSDNEGPDKRPKRTSVNMGNARTPSPSGRRSSDDKSSIPTIAEPIPTSPHKTQPDTPGEVRSDRLTSQGWGGEKGERKEKARRLSMGTARENVKLEEQIESVKGVETSETVGITSERKDKTTTENPVERTKVGSKLKISSTKSLHQLGPSNPTPDSHSGPQVVRPSNPPPDTQPPVVRPSNPPPPYPDSNSVPQILRPSTPAPQAKEKRRPLSVIGHSKTDF